MNNLHTGIVTFFFTGIEGGAKLACERPDVWESVQVQRHLWKDNPI